MLALMLLVQLALPNPAITPGVARPMSTKALCTTKWGKDVRHVTEGMKKQVAAAYGVPWSKHSLYEFDHLISRELAGADAIGNLWPQPWAGEWGARKKDRLENRLHKLVCDGTISLATAQRAVAKDWITSYKKYVVEK